MTDAWFTSSLRPETSFGSGSRHSAMRVSQNSIRSFGNRPESRNPSSDYEKEGPVLGFDLRYEAADSPATIPTKTNDE